MRKPYCNVSVANIILGKCFCKLLYIVQLYKISKEIIQHFILLERATSRKNTSLANVLFPNYGQNTKLNF